MGLHSLNPGCLDCNCCEECADHDQDWYVLNCLKETSVVPLAIRTAINDTVWDFGNLNVITTSPPPIFSPVWYGKSSLPVNVGSGVPVFLASDPASNLAQTDNRPRGAMFLSLVITEARLVLESLTYFTDSKCRRDLGVEFQYKARITNLYKNNGTWDERDLQAIEPVNWAITSNSNEFPQFVYGSGGALFVNTIRSSRAPFNGNGFGFSNLNTPVNTFCRNHPKRLHFEDSNGIWFYSSWLTVAFEDILFPMRDSGHALDWPRAHLIRQNYSAVFSTDSCCPPAADLGSTRITVAATATLPGETGGVVPFTTSDLEGVFLQHTAPLFLSLANNGIAFTPYTEGQTTQPIPVGSYTVVIVGRVASGEAAGCRAEKTVIVEITSCPDPTDYEELESEVGFFTSQSDPGVWVVGVADATIFDWDLGTYPIVDRGVEGLPDNLTFSSTGPGISIYGTVEAGQEGTYPVTLYGSVDGGPFEGCRIEFNFDLVIEPE
jgi:hypothetical protein